MNPSSVDLRPAVDCLPVENQRQYGTCVAFGTSGELQIARERAGEPVNLSELYEYYYTQLREGLLGQEGCKPDGAMQSACDRGICLDASWPYLDANYNVRPPASCDEEAAQYKAKSWRWSGWDELKTLLAKGMAVSATICVTTSFDNLGDLNDWRTMPAYDPHPSPNNVFRGLHRILIIGYDDNAGRYLCQNSWGGNWGDGGFFGIPYSLYIFTQMAVFDDPGVPIINAGWKEDMDITFNRLMDWAEPQYVLPHDTTKTFGPYLYRVYGGIYVGLDTTRTMIVKYADGAFTDLGTLDFWLAKMNGS